MMYLSAFIQIFQSHIHTHTHTATDELKTDCVRTQFIQKVGHMKLL